MSTYEESQAYNDVGRLAKATERIANCMEADEKRKREADERRSAPVYSPEVATQAAKELWKKVPPAGTDPLDGMSFGDLNDMDGHSEWKLAVTRDETILGFSQWLAWREQAT